MGDLSDTAIPKFKRGDTVQVTADCVQADLRKRVGVIADPGPHRRRSKPRWPATYWREESRRICYWIEFAPSASNAGDLLAAEVDEQHLASA